MQITSCPISCDCLLSFDKRVRGNKKSFTLQTNWHRLRELSHHLHCESRFEAVSQEQLSRDPQRNPRRMTWRLKKPVRKQRLKRKAANLRRIRRSSSAAVAQRLSKSEAILL